MGGGIDTKNTPIFEKVVSPPLVSHPLKTRFCNPTFSKM